MSYLLTFIVSLIFIGALGILLFGFNALTVIGASLTLGGILLVVFVVAVVATGITVVCRALYKAGLLIPFLCILLAPFIYMLIAVISSGQPIFDIPAFVNGFFYL